MTTDGTAVRLVRRYGRDAAYGLAEARYKAWWWGRQARRPHVLARERFWLGVTLAIHLQGGTTDGQ